MKTTKLFTRETVPDVWWRVGGPFDLWYRISVITEEGVYFTESNFRSWEDLADEWQYSEDRKTWKDGHA